MKTIEWVMMGVFIAAAALSLYKFYVFFPTKPLEDDDTTPESVELLERIMLDCDRSEPGMDEKTLLEKMIVHPAFDPKHFWRFNENRLSHLIEHYRFKDPNFRR